MNPRIRALQIVAFATVGVALLLGGTYAYQQSSTNAQRINNNCPPGDPCPTAVPNPMYLYLQYLGVILVGVASLIGLYTGVSTLRAISLQRKDAP
ncbi:MAG: hypothetical protein ABSB90_03935 [Thermoplasmata archaeon]